MTTEQASAEARADFQREYESKTCAVCSAEKWRLYPFCRSCSIRLQRAHLMQKFIALLVGQGGKREPQNWPAVTLQIYWRHYDICRDFLIAKAKQTHEGETDG